MNKLRPGFAPATTPRRRFLKYVSLGTATSLIGGKLWRRDVLAYCTPRPDQKDAVFTVRVSDYPALLENWGSVRLGLNPVRPDIEPFPDGVFYPFLINRDASGHFYVLDAECRHASCVVPAYDTFEFGIRCPCHGSLYGVDGAVLQGPSELPLHPYQFEFDGRDTLEIRVPCWGLEVKAVVLAGGSSSRLRLDFNANPNVAYEVRFRERLDQPWIPIQFATTPTGPADQNTLTSLGGEVSLFVDRSTALGFYAVTMVLAEV